MDISILLPTFKRPRLLRQTLNAFARLITEKIRWEVLVIDNGDDQNTKAVVMGYTKKLPIRYIVEKRRGKNNALNTAIPFARGRLIVFTDDDVVPEPNWLIEIWQGTKRWPEDCVFGGRCLPKFPEGHQMPFEHPFFEGAYTIADWDIPEGYHSAADVWGPNMAIRAPIFKEGWRFNPHLGPDGTEFCILGDETEFTLRLEKAGYKAVYLPKALVYHQIPEERMQYQWLYHRAFCFGREDAFIESGAGRKLSRLAGIPLYLFPKLVKTALKYAVSSLSTDGVRKFDRGLQYWRTKGMMYQYSKNRLHTQR
jgi:glycosyltransferase involved in cell wall biosynthesis